MTNQTSLFPDDHLPPTRKRKRSPKDTAESLTYQRANRISRASDPDTSLEAGNTLTRSGKRDAQKRMVLARLQKAPGYTFAMLAHYEASARIVDDDLSRSRFAALYAELRTVFHRRLPDLRNDGLARSGEKCKCAVDGNNKQTWWAMEGA